MDVPDLYHFLAQEISKASNYGPEILAIHVASDNDKDQGDKNNRQVQSTYSITITSSAFNMYENSNLHLSSNRGNFYNSRSK